MTIVIEGGIKGWYDNVNNKVFTNILKKRISDNKFLILLNNEFKCGSLDRSKKEDTLLTKNSWSKEALLVLYFLIYIYTN
jgi:hypothetical protein